MREGKGGRDSQVPELSLALGLGPHVLLLLQQLGHLQVVLSQATLVDVGRQVALDCGHKRTGVKTTLKQIPKWLIMILTQSGRFNRGSQRRHGSVDTNIPG